MKIRYLAIFAAIVVLVLALRSPYTPKPSDASIGEPTAPAAVWGTTNGWRNPVPRQAALKSDMSVASASNGVDSGARARTKACDLLTNAVACVDFVRELRDQLPSEHGNARRQLDGLAKRLFVDDWRMMAMADPLIDGSRANEAFAMLTGRPGEGAVTDLDSLLNAFTSSAERKEQQAALGTAALADHYSERLKQSRIEGFRAVNEVLQQFASTSAMEPSALLKDAWVYVAGRTEAIEWQMTEHNSYNDTAHQFAKLGQHLSPEALSHLGGFFTHAQEGLARSVNSLLEAYDSVFIWRFRAMYGVPNAEQLTAALAHTSLTGVSPVDLEIPGR